MTEKVGFISLGCPKNRVDSEYMLGLLEGEGFQMERRPEEADVLLVNTCTFIEQAQRESIEAILEAAQWKEKGRCRALVVTGCLAQRYGEELRRELPEVDVILGTGGLDGLPGLVRQALARVPSTALSYPGYVPGLVPRLLSTPSHLGYLKIAEGCNNHCSFCIIPAVRGRFRSRRPEVLLEEARALAALGVKELILVAQDVTSYGRDLERSGPLARPGLKKEAKKDSAEEPFAEESAHIPVGLQEEMPAASGTDLAELLQRLDELEDLKWIRLLYTYPGKINERLLTAMAGSRKVVRYLDLPLQHASRKILREMRRAGDQETYLRLIERIRRALPGVVLRSSFIVGFPGERESDFLELLDFLRLAEIDRVGIFQYSQERGTPAGERPDQVPPEVKEERYNQAMALQREIAQVCNQRQVGQVREFLVERVPPSGQVYGRWEGQAPEIDGQTILYWRGKREEGGTGGPALKSPPAARVDAKGKARPVPGDFFRVLLTAAGPYDFAAQSVDS